LHCECVPKVVSLHSIVSMGKHLYKSQKLLQDSHIYFRNITKIEYICTCVHLKDLKRLEWLATLCTVCTREANFARLLHNSSSSVLSTFFCCVACITKCSFEVEPQLMITTISKSIPNVEVLEMDAGAKTYSIFLIHCLLILFVSQTHKQFHYYLDLNVSLIFYCYFIKR